MARSIGSQEKLYSAGSSRRGRNGTVHGDTFSRIGQGLSSNRAVRCAVQANYTSSLTITGRFLNVCHHPVQQLGHSLVMRSLPVNSLAGRADMKDVLVYYLGR